MLVYKFGGTSVGSPQKMKLVYNIINTDRKKIVVLSAISGITNKLEKLTEFLIKRNKNDYNKLCDEIIDQHNNFIDELIVDKEICEQVKTYVKKEIDLIKNISLISYEVKNTILSKGEILSTKIFYNYLVSISKKAVFLDAFDFMKTNESEEPDKDFIKAEIKKQLDYHKEDKIFITQGFICKNHKGGIDNLKRGGSDYSATIIGSVINAENIQIWTDINGIHNNDPRYVKKTKPLKELYFKEAAELAYFGAKILHPQSIRPAQDSNIPVYIKNTTSPSDEGTKIHGDYNKPGIKAVAAKDGITSIKIRSGRMIRAYGFLNKIFSVFDKYKTSIDVVTTSEVAVSLTIDNTSEIDNISKELSKYGRIEIEDKLSIICVVGQFKSYDSQFDKMISSLSGIPIRMISYGGSLYNISIVLEEKYKIQSLKAINKKIFNL